ncbi:hypothetical protein RB620_14740 [Paenibacillus sp. LHD-117]|uniref:hypothetical protein n=1 Tax=Paenibacillus sp. LHD-117 TaxID=3071412 RepID=UPI0027E18A30|nr:hypothetical protein [Paenibacillus sp. LHD-117]MDQ6420685.1 hypothetical protein [Paenibacillus sp. LHD-117]
MRQRKKKTKTWKKILIWAASVIVVLGVAGLFAANYAMDKMIAQLSESLEDELLEDVVAEVDPQPSGTGDTSSNEGGTDEPQQPAEGTPDSEVNSETNDDGKATNQEPNNNTTGEEMASSNSGTNEYSAEISTDKAKDVQEKITVNEKAKLASVLLKELSVDDIKALQELAGGGLGIDEKKEARTLILEKLSPEQYDELIQIAKKYGMSQGKSYAEVSQE